MCQFFSLLILRGGGIRHHWNIDSHSDLVAYYGLRDTDAFLRHFAKAELTPPSNQADYFDFAQWQWRLDEPTRPAWLDEDAEANAAAEARAVLADRTRTTGTIPLIADGLWLLGGTVAVSKMTGGRVIGVGGSAQIRDVWGSAQIQSVGGSAQIHGVGGSARIWDVSGSAQIQGVGDSAQIRDVSGSAQIRNVRSAATLDASAKAHVVA